MKRLACLLLLLLMSLMPVEATCSSQGFSRRAVRKTITVDDRPRTYFVFAPRNTKRPLPLVFVLHGGGRGNARRGSKGMQMERYTLFSAIAEREGFMVCYPEGYEGNWNDGRGVEFIPAHKQNVDDVKFLRRVVDAIGQEYQLDHSRVFATGISNGAFMSHRLAVEASDLFAAIAPVVGGMAEPIAKAFNPKFPVSLFVIQGDSDPLVPFAGGEVGYRRGKKRGKFISTKDAVAKYVKRNGISGNPKVSILKDADPGDGTMTEATIHPDGTGGVKVRLYVVKNGGHAWPGRPAYLSERFIGKVSQDFDASDAIWRFFKSCPSRK